jgi:hypothetical protein
VVVRPLNFTVRRPDDNGIAQHCATHERSLDLDGQRGRSRLRQGGKLTPLIPIVVRPRKTWRIALGFLGAPIVPCALLNAISYARLGRPWGAQTFVGMVVVCDIVIATIAVPVYLLLKRSRISLRKCVAGGAAIAGGLAICLIFLGAYNAARQSGGAMFANYSILQALRVTLIFTSLGGGIGLCFWVIGIWGNPTHDQVVAPGA